MTLLEALQSGYIPIVMDAFGSVHDIIEDNYNGLIVQNGDIEGMSVALSSLMNNEEELLRLSTNAINSSERFTLEKTTKKWTALFSDLMQDKNDDKKNIDN